ncbi:hypothetical protein PFLUV_G00256740 [Perca fluviatilis]|uniref:Uncharacterized protein n=1 Tax=Perca fluviatilis TaxID=8168 RepID=A0A6A5EAR5_PERFL|nr:hypothetical protein PFLUV_G00256740 [Perca fluviatilis]
MGPYHPSGVLYDKSRLVTFSRQSSNSSEIQRITLEAVLGRSVLSRWRDVHAPRTRSLELSTGAKRCRR